MSKTKAIYQFFQDRKSKGNKLITFTLFLLATMQAHTKELNPKDIFPLTDNLIKPTQYWLNSNKPYPTNAWFINLMLDRKPEEPSLAVNIFPYLMSISNKGISLSYASPYFYAEPNYPTIISAFYYQFKNQLTLGSTEPMNLYGLASYHGMAIKLQWNNLNQKIEAPIIQGSPYLTEYFSNSTPQLSSNFKWLSINQQTKPGLLNLASRYELVLALDDTHNQTWILYSEKPINLEWYLDKDGNKLRARAPFSGWLRLVLQKDTLGQIDNDKVILDKYSQTIPLDYQQNYKITNQTLNYIFSWQTQDDRPPLLLSLPHQRHENIANSAISYQGIKGLMVGETTKTREISLPDIPLYFLEPKKLNDSQKDSLRKALIEDSIFLERPFPDDGPYQTGKRYAKIAKLILIANYLGENTLQHKMIAYIEKELVNKMLGLKNWHFQYDTTWGGIIPSLDDYGSRHYNDHHYHYGYWVYTFAVLAKYDAAWLNQTLPGKTYSPKQWIDCLIRDYANQDKESTYFPFLRYQDDYAGHSWASGLTLFEDGQNEQSSSEAVNSYYAIALYALAVKDKDLIDWARFLMTRELVSAQFYWQITKDSSIYSEKFKRNNQVVGNLWDSKIDANAFFKQCKSEYRCGLQYSFGIQMLPFNGITTYLLSRDWLTNASPSLIKLITGEYGEISPAWQWILIKGLSLIMTKDERKDLFNKAANSNPEDYDHGDSKTNTLYFLADD